MPSTFRNGFYGGALAAFIIGLWLVRLWQPENQLRLHSEHLIHQIEQRDWSAVENLVAPDYRDDRAALLTRMRLVLRAVSSLTITATDPQTRLKLPEGTWRDAHPDRRRRRS